MIPFIRVIECAPEVKGAVMAAAAAAWREGSEPEAVFCIRPAAFEAIPGSPFAYWVSEGVLSLFDSLDSVSQSGIDPQFGASTKDDFRFLRCWWEVSPHSEKWRPYPKGGPFAQVRGAIPLVINWGSSARELETAILDKYPYLKGNASWVLHPESSYGEAGVTWTRRTTSPFSCRLLPPGCVFGEKGLSAFCDGNDPARVLTTVGIFNSRPFSFLVELQVAAAAAAARSYEINIIGNTPFPSIDTTAQERIISLVREFWILAGEEYRAQQSNQDFLLPALLAVQGPRPEDGFETVFARRLATANRIAEIRDALDEAAFGLYGIDEAERRSMVVGFGSEAVGNEEDEDDLEDSDGEVEGADRAGLTEALIDWALGSALGRFDIRLVTGKSMPDREPFDPLPACSPGMLQDEGGLPAREAPDGYPLDLPAHGILVDDPGHRWDVVARIEAVFDQFAGEHAQSWIQEVERILGRDLRDWLRRYGFERHLKRYSKSRRKAPVFWHLAPKSRKYGVWLYSSVATRDTFYRVLNDYVEPKLKAAERQLLELRQHAGGSPTGQQRKGLATQESLVEDLRAFREEISLVAPLWKPHLDDGVVLNCTLLSRLFDHHRPWQKECAKKWNELAEGTYDWAGWAMHLWPERVVRTCASDRSVAIAHGLEEALWEEDEDGNWAPRSDVEDQIATLVAERRSPAIESALEAYRRAG